MTTTAEKLLENVYGAIPGRIFLVPHGVPTFTPKNRDHLKAQYNLQERVIITTFGLIGPGKGLEIGLQALARVVEDHPQVLYIIAGTTHPALLKREGERYRSSIEQMVADLNLENQVKFINHYLDDEELGDILYMTDIYLSPYPNLDQAVSGTLAFAVGCGRAIVSTPYAHAREILAGGRGLVSDRPDPDSLARLLDILLKDPDLKQQLEKSAAELGRTITWTGAAALYHEISQQVTAAAKR